MASQYALMFRPQQPMKISIKKIRTAAVSLFIVLIAMLLGVKPHVVEDIFASFNPPAPGYSRVTEVFDGDTIAVKQGDHTEKVRFIGLDTPETHHPDKAVQCFGKAAHKQLESLLEGHDVRLESDSTNTNRDRYDRLLRYVYLDDGTLLNLKMIESGYGFAYTLFPFAKRDEFVAAQASARDQNLGLWGNCEVEQDGEALKTQPE